MKALVTCFSAGGVTAALAKRLAEAIQAPVYEIKPARALYKGRSGLNEQEVPFYGRDER